MAEHNKKDLSDFKKYLKDEVVHGIQQTINENTQNIENNTNAITQNTQDIQNSVTSISNLITSFNGMQTDQHPFLDALLSVWFLTLQVLFSCVPASLVQAYGRVLKDRVPRVLQKQSAVYEPSSHHLFLASEVHWSFAMHLTDHPSDRRSSSYLGDRLWWLYG